MRDSRLSLNHTGPNGRGGMRDRNVRTGEDGGATAFQSAGPKLAASMHALVTVMPLPFSSTHSARHSPSSLGECMLGSRLLQHPQGWGLRNPHGRGAALWQGRFDWRRADERACMDSGPIASDGTHPIIARRALVTLFSIACDTAIAARYSPAEPGQAMACCRCCRPFARVTFGAVEINLKFDVDVDNR